MPRIPITMPKMSMTMETGILVEWLKQPGDPVADGDVVAVVTTDKVDMDVEVTRGGVLAEIVAQPNDVVPVGEPIAYLDAESDDLLGDLFASPAAPAAAPAAETTPGLEPDAVPPEPGDEVIDAPPPAGEQPSAEPAPGGTNRDIRAVPLARRLAAEAGLDLSTLTGTGPNRAIRARDVRYALASAPAARAAAAPQPAQAPAAPAPAATLAGEPLGDAKARRMRLATARAMTPSALVPQFTVYRTLDLSLLDELRRGSSRKVSWTALLTRAYARVLAAFPMLNGYWTDAGVAGNEAVGVSMAIDTPSGLVAPVIRDADRLPLAELDQRIRDMAAKSREGQLDPDWFSGGTGTVSNLGGLGIERFNALVTPPQATALSLGTVGAKLVVGEDREPVVLTGCEVGLSLDHRVADGADGARALDLLQQLVSDPFALLA